MNVPHAVFLLETNNYKHACINAQSMMTALANCGNPMRLRSDLIVLGYTNPALEGTSIDLKCPPGLILVSPNVSICMQNGEWEPDFEEVECHGKNQYNIHRLN